MTCMIPNKDQAKVLWDTYQLPDQKRIHMSLVARVAVYLAKHLQIRGTHIVVNEKLLIAAALLHDIDKTVPKLPHERHPDASVRILRGENMDEVADLVVTHPLHAILDPDISPKTWEQKLLYLADKMVKYDIVGVDKRFALWNAEYLPAESQKLLDECYPLVKELEQEVFTRAGLSLADVIKCA